MPVIVLASQTKGKVKAVTTIHYEVLDKTGTLTPEQNKAVDDYINAQAQPGGQLAGLTGEQIAENLTWPTIQLIDPSLNTPFVLSYAPLYLFYVTPLSN